MTRAAISLVVTANDLRAGAVVYLTPDDRWSQAIRDAELLTDADTAAARLADAAGRQSEVVGPYLAEARLGPDGVAPTHVREAIRGSGPSPLVLPRVTGVL